jgi:Glycosyl transferase family 2.
VGNACNVCLDSASGEYVVFLGSDDYFFTEAFEEAMQLLDGTDMVYFNLRVNNGDIWKLNKTSKKVFVGATKFMRREFVGDTRCPEIRQAEDWYFYQDLIAKDPTEAFSGLTVTHYNFPRKGSLTYLANMEKE